MTSHAYLPLEKPEYMPVNQLELQQKPIVPLRRGYDHAPRARDVRRDLALLGGGEEPVGGDAEDEGAWGEEGEGAGEGGVVGFCLIRV